MGACSPRCIAFVLAFITAAHACVRENVPLHSFKGVSSPCRCMFYSFLFCLVCSVSAGFRVVLQAFLALFSRESVPLHSSREIVPSAGAYNVLLVSSLYCKLVLLFLIYIFFTFDKKKKKLSEL